jgi:hypothetical protein
MNVMKFPVKTIFRGFTEAKNNLYHKGLKALFKVKKCFQGHSPKIKTILHIFDHTIKPILLSALFVAFFPTLIEYLHSLKCAYSTIRSLQTLKK